MTDGNPGQYLVIHSDLQGEAQVVAEPLLAGGIQADLPRCRGRVHWDGQALSSHQDDMDRNVLLGLDSLGTDEDSGPLPRCPWAQLPALELPEPWTQRPAQSPAVSKQSSGPQTLAVVLMDSGRQEPHYAVCELLQTRLSCPQGATCRRASHSTREP